MPSLLDGFRSLGSSINSVKQTNDEQQDGPILPVLPELELTMSDEELLSLKNKWEADWKSNSGEIEKIRERNEDYWLGKHWQDNSFSERPIMDNLIFEATETLLPIVTRQSLEPTVSADDSEEGRLVAAGTQKMLTFLADALILKTKLKKVVRFWMLYRLGVGKIAWSEKTNDITFSVLRPQKLILDYNATITEDGVYTGEYIGEYKTDKASTLVLRFPSKKKEIADMVKDKMGTEVGFVEWWTDEYLFQTLGQVVLGKNKNPHWNYESQQLQTDENGFQTEVVVPGNNHFALPQKPYIFLSVFNLGKHPYDDTGLIDQNLAIQDSINKRKRQIDKNADQTNGGIAVNSDFFSKDEAAQAARAIRQGGVILTPGNPNEIITRLQAPALPNFVYQDLQDSRQVLLGNFGIGGSVPQGTKSEDTVRGKIIVRAQDESRISGITEYLEQFADRTFNWFVQMMYVYYDEPHSAAVLGGEGGQEWVTIKNSDLNRKLLCSVKEGSLIPKDDLTKSNQAVDLAAAGLLDPITLFSRMQFPNPTDTAKRLVQYKLNPLSLFPDLQAQQEQEMAQAQGQGADMPGTPPEEPQAPQEDLLSEVPIQ